MPRCVSPPCVAVLEWLLAEVGAVSTELESDPRERAPGHSGKSVLRY